MRISFNLLVFAFLFASMRAMTAAALEAPVTYFTEADSYTVLKSKGHPLTFRWNIYRPVPPGQTHLLGNSSYDPNDILEITMTVGNGNDPEIYAAIGFSPFTMKGPFVACRTSSAGAGSCHDYHSDATYHVTEQVPQRSSLVATGTSSKSASDVYYTFRIPVKGVGIEDKVHRTIYAYGEWEGDDEPGDHDGDDLAVEYINFYTGERTKKATKYVYTSYGVAAGVTVLLTIIAAIVNFTGYVPSPLARKILTAFMYVVILALTTFVVVYSFVGYKQEQAPGPAARAFGDGVAFLFFLVLWPTTKHIGPVYLLGMSYERMLTPHIVVAILIFLLMSIHFLLMFMMYAREGAFKKTFSKSGHGPRNNLAGAVSWGVMLVALMIPGLFLRRKRFSIFRLFHFLFLIVMIAGAVHHWPMWILIAPSLFMWFLDMLLRTRSHFVASPSVLKAVYYPEPDIIELDIHVGRAPALKPAQYIFITLSKVKDVLHPFSIASLDDESKVVKLFIKASERANSWTRSVANLIEKQAAIDLQSGRDATLLFPNVADAQSATVLHLEDELEEVLLPTKRGSSSPVPNANVGRAGGRTLKELPLANPADVLGKVGWWGPYGSLQVPLEKTKNIVLLSGGIGVTPMITTLQYVAHNGGLRTDQNLQFIWVVRGISIVNLIGPYILRQISYLSSFSDGSGCAECVIHVTGSGPDADFDDVNPLISKGTSISVVKGRPTLDQYFSKFSAEVDHSTLYACGPEALVSNAVNLATERKMYTHTETFEF